MTRRDLLNTAGRWVAAFTATLFFRPPRTTTTMWVTGAERYEGVQVFYDGKEVPVTWASDGSTGWFTVGSEPPPWALRGAVVLHTVEAQGRLK